MSQTIAEKTGAEDVRWDLNELFSSPEDPEIERLLGEALTFATGCEERYKGRIGELTPAEFVAMMEELEAHYASSSKPSLYAHLLHTQDTRNHAAGRLIARSREAGAERGRHMVFFGLEVARLTDEQCAALFADPAAARYRHTVEQERLYRDHHLSEVEERLLTEISPTATGAGTRPYRGPCSAIAADTQRGDVPLPVALATL